MVENKISRIGNFIVALNYITAFGESSLCTAAILELVGVNEDQPEATTAR